MNFFVFLLFHLTLANYHQEKNGSPLCYERWLEGYRLASGRPQKVLRGVTLRICEDECSNTRGCAAFAFGVGGEANGTCELATRTRDSRAATNDSLTLSDVDKSHHYDVYIEKAGDHCFKTSALYGNPNSHAANGVPIDCFYRLMAGKRLSKIHVLKSVSVQSIQECQEACILERTFSCRSISYRYMPTGYTYSVSNCELSSYTETPHSAHDYIEDYDYDYFQREPHCKTTSSINSYGVCAVVVRRGGKLNPGLVKSSHSVTTMGKCEHLCATALFRCRAFSYRHTERGRENYFQRETESCMLHDADISRLPGHNIEANPDFDLYEMGRLMGAECILYDQYNRNRNGGIGHNYNSHNNPPPSGVLDNRNFDRPPLVGGGRGPPYGGSNERHHPDRPLNNHPPYDNRRYDYDRTRFNTDYNSRPAPNSGPRDGQSFHNSSLHDIHPPPHPLHLHPSGPTPLPPPLPPINRIDERPPITAFHNNRPVYMDTLDFHTHRPSPTHPNTQNHPPPEYPGPIRPSEYPGPNRPSEYPGPNRPSEYPGHNRPSEYPGRPSEYPSRPSSEYPGPGNFHSYDATRGEFPSRESPPSHTSHHSHFPGNSEDRSQFSPSPHRYPDDRIENKNPGFGPHPRFPEERNPGYGPPLRYHPGTNKPYPDEREMRPHGGSSQSEFEGGYQASGKEGYPRDKYPDRYQQGYPTAMQISHQSSPIASTIPITTTSTKDQSESPTVLGVFGPPEGIVQGTSSLLTATSSAPNTKTDPPYYDKRREVCLVSLRREAYLAPELSRATFPVKTIEECRIECIRSYDVLRFQCTVMSFRLTSSSGGSCQLSDQDHRQFRESDFVPARDRYEGASVFFYDDRDPICKQNGYSTYNDRYGSGYFGGSGSRYPTSGSSYNDRYPTSGSSYNDRYPGYSDRYPSQHNNERYYNDPSRVRYGESRYDDNYNRYGYHNQFNQAGSYQPPTSNFLSSNNRNYASSSGFTTSNTYNNRYTQGGTYGTYGNYADYAAGTGQTTVNGEKCLRSCRQNREAGFFYCQVDDQGSWDFCCRPDHFCGFSPGLSVSWCYVGTGPSQSIWRSCNHRYNEQKHHVAYLHEGPPPTIQKLSNTEVANLTKDNALLLFKASAPVFPEPSSTDEEEQMVKASIGSPVVLHTLQLDKKDDKLQITSTKQEPLSIVNGVNVTTSSAEEAGNSTHRANRRTPRTPTFTVVDERL